MTWDHRIVRRVWPNGEITFSIHEVLYDVEDRVHGTTLDPVAPRAATLDELRADLILMRRALDKPVVEWDEVKNLSPRRRFKLDAATLKNLLSGPDDLGVPLGGTAAGTSTPQFVDPFEMPKTPKMPSVRPSRPPDPYPDCVHGNDREGHGSGDDYKDEK